MPEHPAESVPRLRLVDARVAATPRAMSRRRSTSSPADAVAMAATDPRWVFAVRVRDRLEGGTAAILTPERRAALLRHAPVFGLRPFDANVIIALVQDAARRGETFLGPEVADRLEHVAINRSSSGGGFAAAMSLTSSALLAVAVVTLTIRWLLGG